MPRGKALERFQSRANEELGIGAGHETIGLGESIRADVASPADVAGSHGAPASLESETDTASASTLTSFEGSKPKEPPAGPLAASKARGPRAPSRVWLAIPIRRPAVTGWAIGLLMIGAAVGGVLNLWGDGPLRLSGEERITDFEGLEVTPALSPSGDRVAYVAGIPGNTKIFVERVAGGAAVPLSNDLDGWHHAPAWAPDGEQVAFIAQSPDGGSRLVLTAPTGGSHQVLVRTEVGVTLSGLAWSPDGRRLAFKKDRSITLIELESEIETHLTDAWAPHSFSWSPDGEFIAFVSENSGFPLSVNIAPSSVWVVSADGGEPQRITPDAGTDQSPAWWPDGRRLLFVSDRSGSSDVYSVELGPDGAPLAEPVRVTTDSARTVSVSPGMDLGWRSRSRCWTPTSGRCRSAMTRAPRRWPMLGALHRDARSWNL